jgi:outer membrane protein
MKLKTLAALLACSFAFAAQAAEGDLFTRVRIINIDPASKSTIAGLDVKSKAVPEIDFTYFLSKNVGAELILGTARHEVTLNGANVGKVSHLPPTLTLQYHFAPDTDIRPYVGAGINYTRFYNVSLASGAISTEKSSFGGALQAGIDFAVSKNGYINIDVKKINIQTDLFAGGTKITTLKIDPVVFGVGFGWKF